MGLLWMSINGSKRSDEYDECQKMAMLNIRLNFSIRIQPKGNNILRPTAVKPTSCDWGFGLWAVVLIYVTITGTQSCSTDFK